MRGDERSGARALLSPPLGSHVDSACVGPWLIPHSVLCRSSGPSSSSESNHRAAAPPAPALMRRLLIGG